MARIAEWAMEERKRKIVTYLAERANQSSGVVITRRELREELGLTTSELKVVMRKLRDEALVRVQPRYRADGGRAGNVYHITAKGIAYAHIAQATSKEELEYRVSA